MPDHSSLPPRVQPSLSSPSSLPPSLPSSRPTSLAAPRSPSAPTPTIPTRRSFDMVDHPFAGSGRSPTRTRASPPGPPQPASGPTTNSFSLPPREALRVLLHTPLHVTLQDGRVLSGHLLAVDRHASLLLGSVRETRILPPTEEGANVAKYYPFSRESAPAEGLGAGIGGVHSSDGYERGGQVREREVASVLVPMRHVVAVEMGNEDAEAWSRFTGVKFEQGEAVPPPSSAREVAGAARQNVTPTIWDCGKSTSWPPLLRL